MYHRLPQNFAVNPRRCYAIAFHVFMVSPDSPRKWINSTYSTINTGNCNIQFIRTLVQNTVCTSHTWIRHFDVYPQRIQVDRRSRSDLHLRWHSAAHPSHFCPQLLPNVIATGIIIITSVIISYKIKFKTNIALVNTIRGETKRRKKECCEGEKNIKIYFIFIGNFWKQYCPILLMWSHCKSSLRMSNQGLVNFNPLNEE